MGVTLAFSLITFIGGVIIQTPVAEVHSSSETNGQKESLRLDIEQYACPQLDLQCGQEPREMPLFTNSCHCTRECVRYGDCCASFPDGMGQGEIHEKVSGQTIYECTGLGNPYASTWNLLLSRCPVEWADDKVKYLCEEAGNEQDFFSVPVTSLNSNLSYRNVYCATCNRETQYELWSVNFLCSDLVEPRNFKEAARSCQTSFNPPETLEDRVEKCAANIISSCPRGKNKNYTYSMSLKNKCLMYLSPVEAIGNGNAIYKNAFCSLCNGVDPEDISCPSTWPQENRIFHSPSNLLSYSFLLDVDYSHDGPYVGGKIRCPPDSIFDPWDEVCRDVHFGGFTEIGDRSSSLNPACSGKIESDFYRVDNFTIQLSNGKRLSNDAFELVNESAVVLCFPKLWPILPKFGPGQSHVTTVCLSLSIAFLTLKIVLSSFDPASKNLPRQIVISLSICLLVAQCLFLIASHVKLDSNACVVFAFLMHYFFLASHFWMNAISFNIWQTFKQVNPTPRKGSILKYSCYGMGMPALLVSLALLVEAKFSESLWAPGYGLMFCWINNKRGLLLFFVLPLLALVVLNVYFFVSTSIRIVLTSNSCRFVRENVKKIEKVQFLLYLKLGLIMGLTWLFGFLASIAEWEPTWYLFILFNGLQGVFLCLAFARFSCKVCHRSMPHTILSWKSSTTSQDKTMGISYSL